LTEKSGEILSSNYPGNYEDSVEQQWHITTDSDEIITLKFIDFETESLDQYGERTDWLRVSNK